MCFAPDREPVACTAAVVDVHPRRRISQPPVSDAGLPCTRCGVHSSRFPLGSCALLMSSRLQEGNCAGCRSLPETAEGALEAQRHQDPESSAQSYAPFSRRQCAGVPGRSRKGENARKPVCQGHPFRPPEAQLRSRFRVRVSGLRCRRILRLGFPRAPTGKCEIGEGKITMTRQELRDMKPSAGFRTILPSAAILRSGIRAPGMGWEGKAETDGQGRRRLQCSKSLQPCNSFSGRFTGRGASFLPLVLGCRHEGDRGKLRRTAGLLQQIIEIPVFLLPPFPFS